jgi:RNA polymerase sigma factor (sigma-70 family)
VSDADLLADYVHAKSEDAFNDIVRMHVGMVYSVCRRQLGDTHWAEDVTQAVFVLLARKAETLPGDVALGGWLFKAALYACSNARRLNKNRKYHEKQVIPMKMTSEPDLVEQAEMEALLDKGLLELNKAQREVLVLRFFENRPLTEVARMRKQSLYATQKTHDAGLARLRRFMKDRGLAVTAGLIVTALTARAAHAVPAGLAGSVGRAALGGSAAQSTYVTQLVGQLAQHTGRVKLLTMLGIAASVMFAMAAFWAGSCVLLPASAPANPVPAEGAAVANGPRAPRPAEAADIDALWDTLRETETALRRMDVPALARLVDFSSEEQKANWDAMVPVFVQNQALQMAGAARFGDDGVGLTAIKTFGERIDEILPQVERSSFQWTLGENEASLYFAFRGGDTPGGSIFFVKQDGRWKIDAGMTVDVALEGLDATSSRVAIQQLDETGQKLVQEKMDALTQSLARITDHIAREGRYQLATARRELERVDASSPTRAFFRLALKYDNTGHNRTWPPPVMTHE